MGKIGLSSAAALLVTMTGAANAAVINATPATFASVWLGAKPGDTLRLTGTFGFVNLDRKTSSPPITIDARKAVFTNTLRISDVTGLKITGGTFDSRGGRLGLGKSIAVYNSSGISLDRQTMVGPGLGSGQGIAFRGVTRSSVTNGTFTGLTVGVSVETSTAMTIKANRVVGSVKDGYLVVDSHNIVVANNSCSGGAPGPGAHPDCVQLWSIAGKPRQSDITIRDNIATGATQGFTSFTPEAGGGERIAIIGNIVNTTFSQGIACYACFSSVFTGNFLLPQPDAAHFISLNVVGGANNFIGDNVFASLKAKILLPQSYSAAYLALTGKVYVPSSLAYQFPVQPRSSSAAAPGFGSDMTQMSESGSALGTVPEPGAWALLVAGFGVVGAGLRRQRPGRTVVCA